MDQTNAAQQEPWWEEFTHLYGNESLRALAKRFGTNPRRLRRAAQRCGLTNEPPELLNAADRLGSCPDDSLAADLGVTPELVKGARLRRQIAAFNPKTLPKPKVRKPKKAKPPRPERPPREHYSRSESVVPTVVVKRTRSRVEPERTSSRVDEGALKLANTLGRIRSEDAPVMRASDEPETSRRRRVVSAERSEEMRGLKPASPSASLTSRPPPQVEGDGRVRRRRAPRTASSTTGRAASGGDDEPDGAKHSALAAARVTKALSRAAVHLEEPASPVAKSRQKRLSQPPFPPRFAPQIQVVAPAATRSAESPATRKTNPRTRAFAEKVKQPASTLVNTAQERLSPVACTAYKNAEMRLWTAEYQNNQGVQISVIAAATFVDALERAKGLGELISVQAAPTL